MARKPQATFRLKDSGKEWQRLRALSKQARDSSVRVGVLGDEKPREEGGLSNVQVATIHEFGAGRIPERSFIRATFDAQRQAYFTLAARLAGALYDGKTTVEKALGLMGMKMVADIRAHIRAGIAPPLAESTLRRRRAKGRVGAKGEPVALIDTSQLINSITYALDVPKLGAGPKAEGDES